MRGCRRALRPTSRESRACRPATAAKWTCVGRDPADAPACRNRMTGDSTTPTWGRTYWGGAMFCLLADVRDPQQSHQRFGIQDALRAVGAPPAALAADWPIERVTHTGDGAVGTTTLRDCMRR